MASDVAQSETMNSTMNARSPVISFFITVISIRLPVDPGLCSALIVANP
jgi:hypothetical protein